MGLDRYRKTPCGFCFVEYYNHQDALDCMKYIGGTKLDERVIRTDLDEGFSEGRQYGFVITVAWNSNPGMLITLLAGASLEGKFATNIVMSTIQAVVAMEEPTPRNLVKINERKRKTTLVNTPKGAIPGSTAVPISRIDTLIGA